MTSTCRSRAPTRPNRINTAIQGGPERLIQTVQQSLGLPVHHYVEVDFAGFLELVDAIGGVEIEFDAPAFDDHSGLVVEQAGWQTLDKNQALAFVRSRYLHARRRREERRRRPRRPRPHRAPADVPALGHEPGRRIPQPVHGRARRATRSPRTCASTTSSASSTRSAWPASCRASTPRRSSCRRSRSARRVAPRCSCSTSPAPTKRSLASADSRFRGSQREHVPLARVTSPLVPGAKRSHRLGAKRSQRGSRGDR